MERRHYTTIFIFFLAITEVIYSHPQISSEQHGFSSLGSVQEFHDDKQVGQTSSRKSYEHNEHEDSDLETLLLNRDDGRRVKRDRKPTHAETLQKIYKEEELATLARRASDEEASNRAYAALLNRFQTTVELYLARGMNLTQAINRFEVNHADLAREVREQRNRRTNTRL